jgi:hypothetical protein
LNRDLNSEPIEIGPSRVIVIRKLEHQSAAPKAIEEAREEIVLELRPLRANDALKEDAEGLRARALDGESLKSLAEEFGADYAAPGRLSRTAAEVAPSILVEAFRSPMNVDGNQAVELATTANGDLVVLAVSEPQTGMAEDLSETERANLEQRLRTQLGDGEFAAFVDSLRNQTKVVLHADKL